MTTTSTSQPTPASPQSAKRVIGTFPQGAKLLLVGEAPGADEEKFLRPFVGAAGKELDYMLADAGIARKDCALTNVFDLRPPNNDLMAWASSKKEAKHGADPSLPWAWLPAGTAAYVTAKHTQPALVRLRDEIIQAKPNIVVALGNVALSALCSLVGIGRLRGTLHEATLVPGLKVLPTYHPAAILRQYDNKPMVIADLMKAKAEAEFPDFRFKRRTLYIEPTLADLFEWRDRLLASPMLAMDIETKPAIAQITCIGFAPSSTESYVIPFWDRRKPDGHYWPTLQDEIIAWQITKAIIEGPSVKIMQNGLYDVQYCAMYGWKVRNFREDTMILHHSLYPSLPKGLDVLGSLYCNERAWKQFRPRGGEEKADA